MQNQSIGTGCSGVGWQVVIIQRQDLAGFSLSSLYPVAYKYTSFLRSSTWLEYMLNKCPCLITSCHGSLITIFMPVLVTRSCASMGTAPGYSVRGCISPITSQSLLGLPKTKPAKQWSYLKEHKSLCMEGISKGVGFVLVQFHKTNKTTSSVSLCGYLIESP